MTRMREFAPRGARSAFKIARAEVAKAVGSDRYAWPALYSMDRRLAERLPEKGVFLEIGANDGYSQSNTYHLEKFMGWKGILIEPLPSMFRMCRLHRRSAACFNVACVGPDGPSSLTLVDRGLMAVAPDLVREDEVRSRRGAETRTVTVPTRRLSDLVDEAGLGTPDLMSVDVEGAELHVLAGLEQRHAPSLLLVETARPEEVEALLPWMRRTGQLSHHDWVYEPARA